MLAEYYIEYFPIEEQNNFVNEHLYKYNAKKRELKVLEDNISNKLKDIVD